jgi:large subunit ribosomal protein L22
VPQATEEREQIRAQARYVRSSARKARLVLEHIRGRSAEEAQSILAFHARGVAVDAGKVLKSAISNAEVNNGYDVDQLIVLTAYADEGPTLKRWRARARGRVNRIRKRTCHITITLSPALPGELKPRPERRPRPARQAEPQPVEETVGEQTAADETAEPAAEEAPAKPKRSRSRKAAAEAPAEEAAAEAEAEAEAEPEAAAEPEPQPEAEPEPDPEPEAEPEAEPDAEADQAAEPETDDNDDDSKEADS